MAKPEQTIDGRLAMTRFEVQRQLEGVLLDVHESNDLGKNTFENMIENLHKSGIIELKLKERLHEQRKVEIHSLIKETNGQILKSL